jgi:DNA-binding CsgD family transcriptional regulator
VSSYARWLAEASRPGSGSVRSGPSRAGGSGRDYDLASEQSLLLDAIAALVYAVAAYGPRGECQYRSVGGDLQDHEHAGLLEAMQALAESVVSPDGETVATPSLELGRIGAVATDISTAAGGYHLRAIRLCPGLFGSDGSVLVIADRLPDDAVDRARIRERFGLTEREAEVAVLLADRRRNAEIARALGISVHTARHHIERVLLKLGGCKRGDVQRVLRSGLDTTEEAIDSARRISGASDP